MVLRSQDGARRLQRLKNRVISFPPILRRLGIQLVDESWIVDVDCVRSSAHYRAILAMHIFDRPDVLPTANKIIVSVVQGGRAFVGMLARSQLVYEICIVPAIFGPGILANGLKYNRYITMTTAYTMNAPAARDNEYMYPAMVLLLPG